MEIKSVSYKKALHEDEMRELENLGIDISIASMFWVFPISSEFLHHNTRRLCYRDDSTTFVKQHGQWMTNEGVQCIPAFTFDDLVMNVLPDCIYMDDDMVGDCMAYHLTIEPWHEENAGQTVSDSSVLFVGYKSMRGGGENFFDKCWVNAAYMALKWVLENGFYRRNNNIIINN